MISATLMSATALATYSIGVDNENPLTIAAFSLNGGETISVDILVGATYTPVYQSGSLLQMTTVNNVIQLDKTGIYKITKYATASLSTVVAWGRSQFLFE